MTPKVQEANPLASFVKLSSSVYLQDPVEDIGYSGKQPRVIVLAFWMNASSRALVKYVVEYRRLAPSAKIVFILSSSNDFMFHASQKAQHARLAPAVEAIQASGIPEGPVFLHMFSNGGVASTTHFLTAYLEATGKPLRVSSMIIDSAPGNATISASLKAFSFVLPKIWLLRYLSKFLLFVLLVVGSLVRRLTRTPDAVSRARNAINNHGLLRGASQNDGPARCYIYSDADELVDWRDVEQHSWDAQAKGWVVQREKFLGSPHVCHMRSDPERYWNIVKTHLKSPTST
ncbi:transmembrane protein 53 [Aspergillus udagawae]|uniref:Transmembrane protein 53 n=1 Tax=Aspergillus udagawae TaxID=91492 RepID=A0A8H3RR65_9EURO|nr:transmembrane protein 53 [Aspergillus udagawae]